MKKIVLAASASYFEGHRHIVTAIASAIKELKDYSLDIFTNYGRFVNDSEGTQLSEASVYELLKDADYDGAIIENNIGRDDLMQNITSIFKEKNIPFVSINNSHLGCPFFVQDYYDSSKQLIEHMILEHGASKINLIVNEDSYGMGNQAVEAYKEVLSKYDIEFEPTRVIEQYVGMDYGDVLYDEFKVRHIDDCDAVICFHDANAIGLINRYTNEGIRVPEDVKVASLHYSNNSMIYRPDVTGLLVEDDENAKRAVLALDKLINHQEVSKSNYSSGRIMYGRSCGCEKFRDEYFDNKSYQNMVLAKISTASQVMAMMSYTQSLGSISSMTELGEQINAMMEDLGCKNFGVCINKRDIEYLTNEDAEHHTVFGQSFDDQMYLLACTNDGSDGKRGTLFPTKDLYPQPAKPGDIHIIMPIHLNQEVYGYIVIKNNLLPAEIYNYRICHESLGQSFEALHQQLILRRVIEMKERLRMQDHMTGTLNKAGLEFYKSEYFEKSQCIVAIADVDGLKHVNDVYGHLQGDNIIQITANALLSTVCDDSIVVRYGGDEFMILSHNMDMEFWENFNDHVNEAIAENVKERQLPYKFRSSLGYAVYDMKHDTPEEAIARADANMYSDKLAHKNMR